MGAEQASDPTSIAVAIGELKTQVTMGFKSVQDSIDKLTAASENQSGKIGDLETKTAVHDSQISEIKTTLAEAKPEKGRAWGIAGVVTAITVALIEAVRWLISIGAAH